MAPGALLLKIIIKIILIAVQDLTQWLGPWKAIMSPKQRPTRCLLTEYTQAEWRYLWLLVIKYGTCCPWSQHIMTSSQNLQSHKLSYTVYKIQSLGSHSIFLLHKVQVHCRKLPHLPTTPSIFFRFHSELTNNILYPCRWREALWQ